MIRVSDPEATIKFFELIGLKEVKRLEDETNRYTLYYLAVPGDEGEAQIELTHNWDEKGYAGGRNFGHLAFHVDDIHAVCERLEKAGVTINRPPRDGYMAFVKTPDDISIEFLQRNPLPPREPWASRPNVGNW
jgi:lactoylglutathione lyase